MVISEINFFYKENLGFLPRISCFFINFSLIHLTVCSSVYNPSEQTNENSETQFKMGNLCKTLQPFSVR